ncbi:Bifunctional glutamate/proline--tRNA ligase [Schistosoma japonicum]|uniref:Bifunctional glutamate/proline--tRNA ligase n=1 Tax=Schistosoma japonicum TaxID=6182 RepID=A0A4Z2D9Q0_SCHJA|nr:Bifunctional glutamate/proline--tRNA ligase [Schistosoma japonicum]
MSLEAFKDFIRCYAPGLSEDCLKLALTGISTKCDLQTYNWVRFASTYFQPGATFLWAGKEIDKAVANSAYLNGSEFSLSDLAVWAFLEINPEWHKLYGSCKTEGSAKCFVNLRQYYDRLVAIPSVQKLKPEIHDSRIKPNFSVTSEPRGSTLGKTHASDMLFEKGGKFGELPGAKVGEVVVRFPPEASGYLHIGHAKAALLNQHYRDIFQGRLILRFDDTNPDKEKECYEKSLLSDLPRIGISWDTMSSTSDHFDKMLQLCEQLIREGKAYVDDTDTETIRVQREARQISTCRNNSIEKNLAWWEEMKKGTQQGLRCCVRAKIDMSSNNGALRDPTIYRCKVEPHVRTGSKYKVYPLYDFACPVVDSIEGVTHALRTSEYNDRNEQYAWICKSLGIRCPLVIDYSRLALQNTVLSKRKLAWFVDEGIVDGWDDPRMPTISGILRHGMTAEGLRQFILAQGSSRSSALMEWDKIWSFNKKIIEPIAPRTTALLLDSLYTSHGGTPPGLVRVRVHGQTGYTKKEVQVHPKNESLGYRTVLLGPEVFVEHADALCFKEDENVTFINWGNLRIMGIHKQDQQIVGIDASLNLEDTDYKKTLKVTWLADPKDSHPPLIPVSCLTYDNLLNKAILGKDEDFKLYVNKCSKKEQCLLGDPDLCHVKKGDIIQIQRRGFYICDAPYESTCLATGHESPCVLINIPDGSSKDDIVIIKSEVESSFKSGSAKTNKTAKLDMTPEEAAKAAEQQRKKQEKKEARKVGKLQAKQKALEAEPKATTIINHHQTGSKPARDAVNDERSNQHLIGCKQSKQAASKVVVVTDKDGEHSLNKYRTKKQSKLAIETSRETDFSEWYSELIVKAELLDYYDISGCYILRPWAYSMWQTIQQFMNDKLKVMGVENAYFPMFVSKSSLEREKDHVTDFAPEVAWVTKSGHTDLMEPIAIRPTSETVMYPLFAKWIQSHRDLPFRINQWCNAVRWEFKHPQPFLRTREFLWQEGHTAFAEKADAEAEVRAILDLYADVYKNLLAVPVVKGRKTEREKFAGADYTTTVEVYIDGNGRAIQGATSHHLGQNFSRMFNVTFDHPVTGKPAYVYQNSWGLTTRTLGVLVMVHSDDKGLVLPPRIAPYQIVIVPCGITAKISAQEKESLLSAARSVFDLLSKSNKQFRVHCDDRDNVSPGWKFNHWELKGVPIRLEIGPQEVADQKVCLVLRYSGERINVSINSLSSELPHIFDEIHDAMFDKATKSLANHVIPVNNLSELCTALDQKSLVLAPFCCDKDCEEVIRHESARNVIVEPGAPAMGAKSLCIPFACDFNPKLNCGCPPSDTPCFNRSYCSRKAVSYTLFGRSY